MLSKKSKTAYIWAEWVLGIATMGAVIVGAIGFMTQGVDGIFLGTIPAGIGSLVIVSLIT